LARQDPGRAKVSCWPPSAGTAAWSRRIAGPGAPAILR